jgi:probable HAF family extracellular repeat protein
MQLSGFSWFKCVSLMTILLGVVPRASVLAQREPQVGKDNRFNGQRFKDPAMRAWEKINAAPETEANSDGRPDLRQARPARPFLTHPVRHEGAVSIPTWNHTLSVDGLEFHYTMVGTDPSKGSATTIVPTVVIPMRFVFSDGTIMDSTADLFDGGVTALQGTIDSPIFQPTDFSAGNLSIGDTQFADAYQRANFWDLVSARSPDYHVLLGQPQVAPTQTLVVPPEDGFVLTILGRSAGVINEQWAFENYLRIMAKIGTQPQTLPIFVNGYTFFTNGDSAFHTAINLPPDANGRPQVQTFIAAEYSPANDPSPDILPLSHEVAEWLDDPFINGFVPHWTIPGSSDCDGDILEVGDPLNSVQFQIPFHNRVYHPQDIAFLSWFVRDSPSRAINGYYSFNNTLPRFSVPCSVDISDSQDYEFETVDPPGSTFTLVESINDHGDLVGVYQDKISNQHGFVRRDGIYTTIDYPGSTFIFLRQINNRGQVVGFFADTYGHNHGFLFSEGRFTVIDVPGAVDTFLDGINNRGEVEGEYAGEDGQAHGFLLRDGQFSIVHPPFSFEEAVFGINDRGDMVGSYDTGNVNDSFGFAFQRGSFIRLDVPGAPYTLPSSINDRGEAAGFYQFADLTQFASGFVSKAGKFTQITYLSSHVITFVLGSNNRGVLVGEFFGDQTLHGMMATPKHPPQGD